jgi:hypothetical protein
LIRSLDLIPERRPWSIGFTAPFWNEPRPFIKKWPQPLDRREPECQRMVDSLIFFASAAIQGGASTLPNQGGAGGAVEKLNRLTGINRLFCLTEASRERSHRRGAFRRC